MKPSPTNTTLYNKIKQEAKEKFKVWPSAYASGWLVKEYKRRGGKYSGKKSKYSGISRWYNEKWINVCKLPRKVSCGRSKLSRNWKENYPYCRPSIRINSSTPKTSKELSSQEIKKRCQIKKRSPMKKVIRRSPTKKVTRSRRVRSPTKKVTRSRRVRSSQKKSRG